MEREKIPKNKKWLAGRWDRLKKKHGYDLKYFLNKFKESFKEKGIDSQTEISKEQGDNEEAIVEVVEEKKNSTPKIIVR
jgi:3-dehydroquinate dehydratase